MAEAIEATADDSATTTGRWVLAAAILDSSIAFIDNTVVNVALRCYSPNSTLPPPMCSGSSKATRCFWPR